MEDLTEENVHRIFLELLQEVAMLLGPIMLVALVVGCGCKLFSNWIFIFNRIHSV